MLGFNAKSETDSTTCGFTIVSPSPAPQLTATPWVICAPPPAGTPATPCPIPTAVTVSGQSTSPQPTATPIAYAEFRTTDGRSFVVQLTSKSLIDQAAKLTRSSVIFVKGQVLGGGLTYNSPWSWYIDPSSVTLPQVVSQACDGKITSVIPGQIWCPSGVRFYRLTTDPPRRPRWKGALASTVRHLALGSEFDRSRMH